MSDKQEGKSFITTLPGILGGCAALITAIGGVITALYAAGLLQPFFPVTPTIASTPIVVIVPTYTVLSPTFVTPTSTLLPSSPTPVPTRSQPTIASLPPTSVPIRPQPTFTSLPPTPVPTRPPIVLQTPIIQRVLYLNIVAIPQTVGAGEKSTLYLTLTDQKNQVVEGAKVLVQAGGGMFLQSASTPYDPNARLQGPFSVAGYTALNGVYTAWWVCNPCAPGYQLSAQASKDGYVNASGQLTITIK